MLSYYTTLSLSLRYAIATASARPARAVQEGLQAARIRLARQPLGPRARVVSRSFEKANIIPRTDLKYGRRANCLGIMLILAAVTH